MREHARVGIVIPYGAGRRENLIRCLRSLEDMEDVDFVEQIVIVADGPAAGAEITPSDPLDEYGGLPKPPGVPLTVISLPKKHEPGAPQPRNIGVQALQELPTESTHAWFIDSDLIFNAGAFNDFRECLDRDPDRILIGPYDWLGQGKTEPQPELRNDPRWPSFDSTEPDEVFTGDLSKGLACFSGNLIWPIDRFQAVGGFWSEIHHGRCEDGELGLRAVAMGVPISLVKGARAWHVHHERNMDHILAANARDVPMLNARHPWVEGEGLFVVDEDGARFDVRCDCGWEGNTALIWQHQVEECRLSAGLKGLD